jgi:fibronectin type 3 domain-containing protein
MRIKRIGSFGTLALLILSALSLTLAACSGGNRLSTQVVSGVASAGSALSGQVSLKDAATPSAVKTTVIGSDGSYAIDVTGMKAPFIIEAVGSVGGTVYTLHSFANGPGTANINPLSEAAVANASGVDDPGRIFKNPDMTVLNTISTLLRNSVASLMAKLQPLLKLYGAENADPIGGNFSVNHLGLDGMFDNVRFTLAAGILTITDVKTGTDIFAGNISDIANWNFPSNPGSLPAPPVAPTAPTGVTATGAARQVTLTWTSVSNATSYNVYYATTTGVTPANGTRITGASPPYVQTGLSAGTTYYFIVTAMNSGGESAASTEASAATPVAPPPPPPVPAAPTGVSATGGTKQVTISWPAVTGATSYNLYWSQTSGVTTSNGTKITGATSPAVQTALSDGTTYYYIVTATNVSGESTPSVQVAATTLTLTLPPTAPAAPTGLSATGGDNRVTLAWPAVSGATSYNIYYSTTSGAGTGGTKIAGVTSPYVQTGLSAGTTYFYVVTAQNAVGESGASDQAGAATNAPPPALPAAPTGMTATGGANQVTLSWSAVAGATAYNIYWSTTAGSGIGGTKIGGASSPYLQTGLPAGTSYYYVVTAVNDAGEGPASSQAVATTNAPAPVIPAAPTGVTAIGGANQVTLSWSAVAGATAYNIYWSTTAGSGIGGTKIGGSASPYVQTGLPAGTTYFYVVTAMNAAGEGMPSAQASATTNAPLPPLPAAPTGVAAMGGVNQASISWADVTGATSYNIYWSTSSGAGVNGTRISGAASPYLHSGLTAGATYYYVVTALNAAGESQPSVQVSATTTAATPPFNALSYYNTVCLGCHGKLGPRTAEDITSAIATVGAMNQFLPTGSTPLTAAQIAAIAAVSH